MSYEVGCPLPCEAKHCPNANATNVTELILSSTAKYGSKKALVNGVTGHSYTFEQLATVVSQLSKSLLTAGIKPTEKVAVVSFNCPEYIILQLANGLSRIIQVDLSPHYTTEELVRAMDQCDAEVIIVQKALENKVHELCRSRYKRLKAYLILESIFESLFRNQALDVYNNCRKNNTGLKAQNTESYVNDNNSKHLHKNGDDIFLMAMSSGTTGFPKSVLISHKCRAVGMRNYNCIEFGCPVWNDRMLAVVPFYHAFGNISVHACLMQGCEIVTVPKFEKRLFLETIEKFKITYIYTAPPVVMFLADNPLVDEFDLSSIRYIVCSAAPLNRVITEKAKKRIKCENISQLFGMSEVAIVLHPLRNNTNIETVGVPVHGAKLKVAKSHIIDPETGKSVGPMQTGELVVKAACCTPGYYGNSAATKEMIDNDGWHHTGDLFYYDESSHFYCTGRLKEIIKYNGIQVSIAELEQLLLEHPNIEDCAVVGKEHSTHGQLPTAFVVPRPNSDLTEREVHSFIDGRVAYYKKLRGGVHFVDEIPRSAAGKILRKPLQELLKTLKPKETSKL